MLLLGSLCGAQVQILDPPQRDQSSLTERSFVSLYGDVSAVGFQPGSLDRAHHFLERLEVITHWFNKWSGTSVPLVGYLVNREQWVDMGMPGIYGLPVRTSATSIVVPSQGDAETVRMWRSILGVRDLPLNPGEPLMGTSQEAASLAIIDVLAQVEAARGFVGRASLTGDEPWVGEVAAHLTARVLFAEIEPTKLTQIDFIYDQMYQRFGGDGHYALAEFRIGGLSGEVVDTEAWLWFQGAFARAARLVHEARGRKALKHFKKLQARPARLTGDNLRHEYPALEGWMATSFR
jgi:hypothetical protein